MTLPDLVTHFFPSVHLSSCRQVLQDVLGLDLYRGNRYVYYFYYSVVVLLLFPYQWQFSLLSIVIHHFMCDKSMNTEQFLFII